MYKINCQFYPTSEKPGRLSICDPFAQSGTAFRSSRK